MEATRKPTLPISEPSPSSSSSSSPSPISPDIRRQVLEGVTITDPRETQERLKKECSEEVEALRDCKKNAKKDYRQECHPQAMALSHCAAKVFCSIQREAMVQACTEPGTLACVHSRALVDDCFRMKQFPVLP
eukprot:TRINITY_DN1072_c0_g1_i2.p1 TRINITY_DN1072_c0_g1~~TRINITY_DN1072_c0_g1_i2.p1  ORF type:complete len:133 (-),score=35.10 TRINITY_DN1072_c0_g1_i2:184-582(-)